MSQASLLSSHEGTRMKISRGLMNKGCGWLVVVGLLGLLGLPRAVDAAEFACAAGDAACLISAIHAANANGAANTITLAAGLYTLTTVDNTTDGPTGLPSITSALTLRGQGAQSTVIERAAGAPQFRLLHVAATGVLTLEGLTLRGGDVAGLSNGGGLRNRGTLLVAYSTLRGNTATSGGGISNAGTLAITQSTLRGNTATSVGGGIFQDLGSRPTTLTNSTIRDNLATSGGGVATTSGALLSLTIANSTLLGNMASNSGGGIAVVGTQTGVILTNSTVVGNLATVGGGVSGTIGLISVGIVISQNTILAGNWVPPSGAGPDCYGPHLSRGHNLIGDPTGCNTTWMASDLMGDPGFDAFIDEGTPGQGYVALLPTSPAIDAGDPAACPATDQLGQLREPPCDIGAIEFYPMTLTLGLNRDTFHAGEILRVGLGARNPGPTVTADFYFGFILPDGVTVLFVTRLAPLDGVLTRLDADPRTFRPFTAALEVPQGFEATVADFLVYAFSGGELLGRYTLLTLLTPAGAFADGQVDAGDILAQTLQPFTVSP
jgi:parallel beta-helix repeat protein